MVGPSPSDSCDDPSAVQFLREKVGFDDEDAEERARVSMINEQNGKG
jgi:hypothetical protein